MQKNRNMFFKCKRQSKVYADLTDIPIAFVERKEPDVFMYLGTFEYNGTKYGIGLASNHRMPLKRVNKMVQGVRLYLHQTFKAQDADDSDDSEDALELPIAYFKTMNVSPDNIMYYSHKKKRSLFSIQR